MPELSFRVTSAAALPESDRPMVTLRLEVTNTPANERIESILLRCQIQIQAARRRYSEEEQRKLLDLFGEPERWGETLRSLQWANVAIAVPGFAGTSEVELHAPCRSELNSSAANYFDGLDGGTAPIALLFSGIVYYVGDADQVQVSPISWNSEARFQFPVEVWRRAMEQREGAAV
ncbi:MAG TPA: DUF6084 family protein [Bryobacteraceae bacterium]|nr:DUF6084 family protein [Bryobacteraceae bacterium]